MTNNDSHIDKSMLKAHDATALHLKVKHWVGQNLVQINCALQLTLVVFYGTKALWTGIAANWIVALTWALSCGISVGLIRCIRARAKLHFTIRCLLCGLDPNTASQSDLDKTKERITSMSNATKNWPLKMRLIIYFVVMIAGHLRYFLIPGALAVLTASILGACTGAYAGG